LLATIVLSGFAGHLSAGLGRAVAALGAAGALALAAGIGWVRARRRVGDALRTARWLGQRIPELSTDVLAAVELRRALEARPDFSEDLARAFLAHADALSEKVKPAQLSDARTVRRAGLVIAGTAALGALALLAWPDAWRGGQALVWKVGPRATAPEPREPITGDLELTYRYPAYTGLAPRTVNGTGGEVTAPKGTEILLKTRADREVDRADLIVNGQTQPLQVSGGRELTGRFVLDKAGTYHFAFLSSRGRVLAEGPDAPINLQADAPPQVRLLLPAEELEVDKGQKVTLKFDASDDYGLSSLALVFRPPRGQEKRVALPHDEGRRASGTYVWDVGDLSLQPGDRVSYFIEAQDNDAVDGPQKGVSRTQVLKLYSALEHRREAVRKVELLWERLVQHLANRMEGPDRADPLDSSKVASQRSLDQAGMDLATDMSTVASEISQERDAPRELFAALSNVADGFARHARITSELRRQFLQYQRAGLSGMGRQLNRGVTEEIHEAERDILYLEALIDREKLSELKELARQLDAQRRDLANLVDQMKRTQDPALEKQLLAQVEELRKRIEALMQRMAELAKGIRDEHLNLEALQELSKDRDIGSLLDEVQRLLREGKTQEALAKLQELEMKTQELTQQVEKADDQLADQDYPELAQKFQSFMDELNQTAQAQQRLSDDTRAIRDRYKEKARERIKQKAGPLKTELLKEVEEVERDYKQAAPEEMSMRTGRDLERVESELENLQSAIKAEDYDMAAEEAQRSERDSHELFNDAEQQAMQDELYSNPSEVRAQSRRRAERMGKDVQKIDDVRQKLDQLLPQPGQMLSEEDRQRLRQQSQEQRQMEKRAQGLQQKMDELSQMAPIFDPDAQQQMQQVGERMGDAAQRMDQRDPGHAYGEERAAAEQLQQFQKQMQSSQKSGGRGGLPLPMFAGAPRNSSQEKVEIPDADQYRAPKEFRKDLLDAMKQGAPDRYKDQVKRYYEELVK
jgi:hypothetical protein